MAVMISSDALKVLTAADQDFDMLRKAFKETLSREAWMGTVQLRKNRHVTMQTDDEMKFVREQCAAGDRFRVVDVRQGKREKLILVCAVVEADMLSRGHRRAEFIKSDFEHLSQTDELFREVIKTLNTPHKAPALADVDRGNSWGSW